MKFSDKDFSIKKECWGIHYTTRKIKLKSEKLHYQKINLNGENFSYWRQEKRPLSGHAFIFRNKERNKLITFW